MTKYKKGEWVASTIWNSPDNGIDYKPIGKVLSAPRFNENVYYVEFILPNGEIKKLYRADNELEPIGIKDVIVYKRNYGLQD